MIIHKHLMENHLDEIERSDENPREFVFSCPECDEVYRIEGGSGIETEETITKFKNEIKMMVFDNLLNHLENEHGY